VLNRSETRVIWPPAETSNEIVRSGLFTDNDLLLINKNDVKVSAIIPKDWEIIDNSGSGIVNKDIKLSKNNHQIIIGLTLGGSGRTCIYPDNPKYGKTDSSNFASIRSNFIEITNYSGLTFRIDKEAKESQDPEHKGLLERNICQKTTNSSFPTYSGYESTRIKIVHPSNIDKNTFSELENILKNMAVAF